MDAWNDFVRNAPQYDRQGNVIYELGHNTYANYSYDSLNRLISTSGRANINSEKNYSNTYEYDSLGNLISTTENGVRTNYEYNKLNQQVTRYENRVGATVYTNAFDKRGNLTRTYSGGTTYETYTYDATNRMVKGINQQGQISEYQFNGLGYLAETKRNGLQKSYAIDYTSELKNVIMETESGANGLAYRYVYGLKKVSVTVGGEKLFYHLGRLGSAEMLTNKNGSIRNMTAYDPWGRSDEEQVPLTVNGRSINVMRTFTGYSYDDVLNLYFAQARMYDPVNKRFMAADPIKGEVLDPMTLVPYAYVQNNPLVYVDPMGLFPDVTQYFKQVTCIIDKMPTWAQTGAKLTVGTVGIAGTAVITGATAPILIAAAGGTAISAALGGVIKAYTTYKQGGGKDQIMSSALLGAASGAVDGYMWGGIFSAGGTALKAAKSIIKPATLGKSTYGNLNSIRPVAVKAKDKVVSAGVSILGNIKSGITKAVQTIKDKVTKGSAKAVNGMRTPEQASISIGDARRIQNAANRTNQKIIVVGSRAKGTASPTSDWDYIMSGNSAQRHSAASSVPRGTEGGGINSLGRETGIDIFTNYPNTPANNMMKTILDKSKPHVIFTPKK